MNNIERLNLDLIDLFAGIGGIRLGFEKYFEKCVFTSEKDKFARETYLANFPSTHNINTDITNISEQDIPKHDILLAGFPCQSFSIAGKRKGFEDTRGTLFFDIARILNYHKPEILFLENVKGLLFHDKGKTFNIILETLHDLGYNIYYDLLNSKDFGLPQNRERVYIVGFKDKNIKITFPKPTYEKTRLGDILEEDVDDKYTMSDQMWATTQLRQQKNTKNSYGLFNSETVYTKTLIKSYSGSKAPILIEQENKNPRALTPLECKRLQGFPRNFIIPVSNTQAYKQFGNSVSVPVVEAIAKQIYLAIKDSN